MSDKAIGIIRWVLLASALLNILQATLLFDFFERRVFQPWFSLSERVGGRVPEVMRDKRMHRIWPILMAVVFLGLWWYLGTADGVALLRRHGTSP
jgi:hypothetical protein